MCTALKRNITDTNWQYELVEFLLWLNASVLLLENVSLAFFWCHFYLDTPSVQKSLAQCIL
jgi:hypothetical protein